MTALTKALHSSCAKLPSLAAGGRSMFPRFEEPELTSGVQPFLVCFEKVATAYWEQKETDTAEGASAALVVLEAYAQCVSNSQLASLSRVPDSEVTRNASNQSGDNSPG
jgi:hypothetical protein